MTPTDVQTYVASFLSNKSTLVLVITVAFGVNVREIYNVSLGRRSVSIHSFGMEAACSIFFPLLISLQFTVVMTN